MKRLMRRGNTIGIATKVDSTMFLASRGRFALVCMEFDLSKLFDSFHHNVGKVEMREI